MLASLVALLYAVSAPRALDGVAAVREAQVHLPLDPQQPPRTVPLPHILDDESPAWWGWVTYTLAWPATLTYQNPAEARLAVLLPRVGPRFRLLLNDREIAQMGWYGPERATVLSTAQPHLVALPSSLLLPQATHNRLIIEVRGQPLERSGLSPLHIGDHDVLLRRHRQLEWWQITGAWIMATLALFVGVLALLLWRVLGERLFLLMGGAALALMARTVMLVVVEPPLPYELLFFLHRLAFALFVGLFILMVEDFFGRQMRWVRIGSWLMIGLTVPWMVWAQWVQDYAVVRAWAGAITVFAIAALSAVVVEHQQRGHLTFSATAVGLVAAFALLTGIRDFLVVQLDFPGDGELRWLTFGSIVLMFALGAALVERATSWARDVQRLNASLSEAVARRENELREAFQRLRLAERQRVVEEERRRLMRDMHDGLGSQLVQTLNLVRSAEGHVERSSIEALLRQALDELRLTLDSLEPMEGDLPAILGTLRRRLGPALEAAGLELRWEVQDVPPLQGLDARGVMHLFRCLQEILANVVKHAHATRVTVSTWLRDDHVVLTIEDDGTGLPPPEKRPPGGRGLRNIITRATKLGASVRFYDAHPGTGIELAFPLHGNPPAVDSAWMTRAA
ncbi:sensor histidine kinase [Tepidimonas charontis]|uniref:sensor histidine kinase n=1 Tax=Tepidimonas charontis TaxID=2267262 RepID=UPI0013759487|nr:ATP-binding protein [Tepidimonas charontis]